jgi:hypothetical protein
VESVELSPAFDKFVAAQPPESRISAAQSDLDLVSLNQFVRRLSLDDGRSTGVESGEVGKACRGVFSRPVAEGKRVAISLIACRKMALAKQWREKRRSDFKGSNGEYLDIAFYMVKNGTKAADEAIAAGQIKSTERAEYYRYLALQLVQVSAERNEYANEWLKP